MTAIELLETNLSGNNSQKILHSHYYCVLIIFCNIVDILSLVIRAALRLLRTVYVTKEQPLAQLLALPFINNTYSVTNYGNQQLYATYSLLHRCTESKEPVDGSRR